MISYVFFPNKKRHREHLFLKDSHLKTTAKHLINYVRNQIPLQSIIIASRPTSGR